MKKVVYATLIIFIAVLIVVAIVAVNNTPKTVTYKDGKIIEDNPSPK
jgi:archaellum component FlaG (FlaF/FlaG flagellin family)